MTNPSAPATLRAVRLCPWVEGEARAAWCDVENAERAARNEFSRRYAIAVEAARNQRREIDFPALRAQIMAEMGLSEPDMDQLFRSSDIPADSGGES